MEKLVKSFKSGRGGGLALIIELRCEWVGRGRAQGSGWAWGVGWGASILRWGSRSRSPPAIDDDDAIGLKNWGGGASWIV